MKDKNLFLHCIVLSFMCMISAHAFSLNQEMKYGKWSIVYNETTKMSDFIKDGKVVLADVCVKAKADGSILSSTDYTQVAFSNSTVTNELGDAQKYTIVYTKAGKPTIRQIFYLYPDKDYFLTEVLLASSGTSKISSNYIAPVYTTAKNSFIPSSVYNRMLFVPYDNDGFVRYGSLPLTMDSIAFEVTSIFNGASQNGLVIGSVDHDTWKSAIRMSASQNAYINKLECFSGVSHGFTHDDVAHGSLRSLEIKSSRMLVGFFDDWRTGLETYADVNAAIAPPRTWTKGKPFGWNSWGGMSTHVNYDGVISVSDFVKDNLQNNDFNNEGTVYLGLDSYWDNLSQEDLKKFADHCYANGQIPGVYWTPFCDWFGWSRGIEGSSWNYADTWTYANGSPKSLCGAKCMDPTHPGTLQRMDYFIARFKAAGFKYIKLDFLTNGSVEGDFFYGKGITTGTQAYNFGMKYLSELCGDDIFLVESIAPLFPARYAHARRISCDAWGEMYHTEYMMNSLSFGWWLDRVYVYNDADHLVMGNRSEGENRARMTSGAITGLYMLGDNLSTAGDYQGDAISREKVKQFATNTYINEIARTCKSFRPAYGHKALSTGGAIDLFSYETKDCYYIAYFNYVGTAKSGYLDLSTLGIDASNVSGGKECWTKIATSISGGMLRYSVPGGDARVYKLEKKSLSNVIVHSDKENGLQVLKDLQSNHCIAKCWEPFDKVIVTSLQGIPQFVLDTNTILEYPINTEQLPHGFYIITVETLSGKRLSTSFVC